jgi:phosphoribosylglycinamide formyltransferase 2
MNTASTGTLGTPFTATAKKVLLLGSGELGKEVVIELKRLGCEVVACDSYAHAPAMQVADRSYVFSMLDAVKLREVILLENPDLVVPEIEAIATAELLRLEEEGVNIIPSAKAVHLTMNREGIRRLVAENLGVATSPYRFAQSQEEFNAACEVVGYPCIVKPVMSSSGKGQSTIKKPQHREAAWEYAQRGGRSGEGMVIVEGFVNFDYEITLLTVRHVHGTSFCLPIGHRQENGDYQESWQPQPMEDHVLIKAQAMADKVTSALGGYGIFGVELFVRGDEVIFSEVSPRPHDTGLVTLISQNFSEFALHARAILGLPIPAIEHYGPSASRVIMAKGQSQQVCFSNLVEALDEPQTDIRLFAKPEVNGYRRMGVALARAGDIIEATRKAIRVENAIVVEL